MSDQFLAQDPLLVFPQTLKHESEEFLRRVNSVGSITPWFSPERQEELQSISDEIEEDFPHMQRYVNWMRSMLRDDVTWEPYPAIRFLYNIPKSGQRWCQFNLGERVPRPKPHPLQVVFHRGRGGG